MDQQDSSSDMDSVNWSRPAGGKLHTREKEGYLCNHIMYLYSRGWECQETVGKEYWDKKNNLWFFSTAMLAPLARWDDSAAGSVIT